MKSHESISIEIERALKKTITCQQQFALRLVVHPELLRYLDPIDKSHLLKMCEELNAHLEFATDDNVHLNDFYFVSTINNKKIES